MNRFNIRIYGILINQKNELLLSDERIGNFKFTKFPGGGLEFGEGTLECLHREFKEELNINIEIQEHFYTTDFFQISAFDKTSQILSIYYWVKTKEEDSIKTSSTIFDFNLGIDSKEDQNFRWLPINKLSVEDVTLPIDKKVVSLILESTKK